MGGLLDKPHGFPSHITGIQTGRNVVSRSVRVIAATAGALFLSLGVLGGTAQADSPGGEVPTTQNSSDSLGWDLLPHFPVEDILG